MQGVIGLMAAQTKLCLFSHILWTHVKGMVASDYKMMASDYKSSCTAGLYRAWATASDAQELIPICRGLGYKYP